MSFKKWFHLISSHQPLSSLANRNWIAYCMAWDCSSYRSISFRESMLPPRESVTHWPINWQSALIPSSSQELFFLVPSFCVSTVRDPWASNTNRPLSNDCYWFHLESIAEENAAASFAHASYKPRTNILTSNTKGILSHSQSFSSGTLINLSLLFKKKFRCSFGYLIKYSVREINHFPKH